MISYTSAGVSTLVQMLRQNLRDLSEPANDSFYKVDFSAQKDINKRYQHVVSFREESGLDTPPPGSFSSDTSVSGGYEFFRKVVTSLGVEETFREDLVTSNATVSTNPRLQSFISKAARQYDLVPNTLLPTGSTTTLHLLSPSPALIADEDTETFNRMKRVHSYVRQISK